MQEPTSRGLPERTGRHLCVRCLREIALAEFLRNDHLCDACAATDEYPLKSTSEAAGEAKAKR